MASLNNLPTDLFDRILHHLAVDDKGLLSLRAVGKRYRDYVDSMLPEIAWHLAGIEDHLDRVELNWIDQQMYDELHQIKVAYWNEPGVVCDCCRIEWRCSKRKGKDHMKMAARESSIVSAPNELSSHGPAGQDWWLDSDSELLLVLATFEHLACDEWWILNEGQLPAILSFFEDPLTYPLAGTTSDDPWWAISRTNAPFVLRNLRHRTDAEYKAPYRNLARIRRMARLRDVTNHLFELVTDPKYEGQAVIDHLGFDRFLEYQTVISEVLFWERPPRGLKALRRWIFLEGLRVDACIAYQ